MLINLLFSLSLLVADYSYSTSPVKIGVIGDTQYKNTKQRRVFQRAIKDMNRERISFLIHLGDQDERGGKRRYRNFKRRISSLAAPFFLVLGNHDLSLRPVYLLWPPLRRKWKRFWGYSKSYYHFDAHGYKFVILDTALAFTRKKHSKWFAKVLDSYKGRKKVFLFMHRPLPIPYASTIYYNHGRKHLYQDMAPLPYLGSSNKRLWRAFYRNRHKIAAVFFGHYHAFRRLSLFGVKAFCSAGGGGKLEKKSDFYHYLLISLKNNRFRVDVRKL